MRKICQREGEGGRKGLEGGRVRSCRREEVGRGASGILEDADKFG